MQDQYKNTEDLEMEGQVSIVNEVLGYKDLLKSNEVHVLFPYNIFGA